MISPLAFFTLSRRLHAASVTRIPLRAGYAPQEVPESRLGDNFVGRKDAHTVDLGGGFRLSRKMATDHLVFLK